MGVGSNGLFGVRDQVDGSRQQWTILCWGSSLCD